jgi:hypothetical protein
MNFFYLPHGTRHKVLSFPDNISYLFEVIPPQMPINDIHQFSINFLVCNFIAIAYRLFRFSEGSKNKSDNNLPTDYLLNMQYKPVLRITVF